MQQENEIKLDDKIIFQDYELDFKILEEELDEKLKEIDFLENEKESINNPIKLGEIVEKVIWEQFQNQLAIMSGEDFIKENNDKTLNLRKEAHYQTADNFAKGKIASHNTEINYQQRHDDWQKNFKKNENGENITHKTRSGKENFILKKGVREDFDKNRPKGSLGKGTDQDHIVSAAEIIRNPAINAHLEKEDQIKFANSEVNLNEIDSSLNRSKRDKSMEEWLDNPNSKGQKPKDIFNLSDKEEKELREKDKKARENLNKWIKKGEERSEKAGKESRKKEFFRISKAELKSAIMLLLTEFLKEIIKKLVSWFRGAQKNLETFYNSLKEAVKNFIYNLKKYLINVGDSIMTTLMRSIFGQIVNLIKKFYIYLKNGWNSLKEAYNFLKNSKDMPIHLKIAEVGKIIVAGISTGGAILLGEIIEKSLISIPIFAIEIPLLGSLANILGIFLGAVTSGIMAALLINLIDKFINKKIQEKIRKEEIKVKNEIIEIQNQLYKKEENECMNTKVKTFNNIISRHLEADKRMKDILEGECLKENFTNSNILDEISFELDSLLKK